MILVKDSEPVRNTHSHIIAIDGYSSCGKSTFAKLIARELNYVYIDSGAMYRAVALYCIENGLLKDDLPELAKLREALINVDILFKLNIRSGLQEIWLNGRNVEGRIRGMEVSAIASTVSKDREVRTKMVALQRKTGENGGVVMDGRDIGTVVFPNAALKIFMTADVNVRAHRRLKELREKGMNVNFQEVLANITMRDHQDENRKESPLRKAADAVVIDNSHMTVDQQMEWFRKLWKKTMEGYEH